MVIPGKLRFLVLAMAMQEMLYCQAQNLYLAQSQGSPYVAQFTIEGSLVGQFTVGVGNPIGLAFDRDGNFFVSDPVSGIIRKISPRGYRLARLSVSAFYVQGLTTDVQGNLYAAQADTVLKFSTKGEKSVFASLDGADLKGLALDTNGCLYASALYGHSIEKFGPDGAYLGPFATNGLNQPGALAFDTKGNLYVANTAGHNITRFSPSGEGTVISGPELNWPTGLAFDHAGNLYVADTVNGSILKYSPAGDYLGPIVTNLAETAGLAMQVIPEIKSWGFQAISSDGNFVQLTWDAIVGQLYQIHYKTNLLQPDWLGLGAPITATNRAMSYLDALGGYADRYYRAQLIP
jgi:sugar lactone lactonase YvrE